jgi:hypothetical protein
MIGPSGVAVKESFPLYIGSIFLGNVYDLRMVVIINNVWWMWYILIEAQIGGGVGSVGGDATRSLRITTLSIFMSNTLSLILTFKSWNRKDITQFCVVCQVLEHDTFRSLSEDIIMTA